jgi:titin
VGFPINWIGVCNTNDSGEGSLRQAIIESNNSPPGLKVIVFSVPTPQPQQTHTIHLLSPLPTLANPAFLDAISLQLDFDPRARRPMIELDGTRAGSTANGLVLNGSQNVVRGLTINNFGGSGIILQNGLKDFLFDNYIGTDATGTLAAPNNIGVTVRNNAQHAFIAHNVISGNTQEGILLTTASVTRTVVRGNKIGTDYLGRNALPNHGNGVVISQGASDNRVLLNTISGNIYGAGVSIQDRASTKNVIAGNHIGTNAAGTLPVPNATGVLINQAIGTIIGRPSGNVSQPGPRSLGNLISGNSTVGIDLINVQPNPVLGERGTTIRNNFIGTDITGMAAMSNRQGGITVQNSIGTTIGSTDPTFPNVIAGNGNQGILLSGGTTRTLIEGNFIGTDVTGAGALSDTIGIYVQGSSNNTIGGRSPGAGNVLSGNAAAGVTVVFNQSVGNVIQGNFIGTDSAGDAVANGIGINVTQAAVNTTIGGTASGAENIIQFNSTNGITISDAATGTLVQGNAVAGNQIHGVAIARASNNTIGGLDPGAGNTILGNGADGVLVDTGTGNLIQANSISSNLRLGIELTNHGNLSQAAPVITSAASSMSQNVTTVTGTITGLPNTAYTVDFYYNTTLDATGFGEGEVYLGAIPVTTDASGHGSMSMVALPGFAPPMTYLTATVTDPGNNTSQFSVGVQVASQTSPQGDGNGDSGDASPASAADASLAQALGNTLDENAAAVLGQGATTAVPQQEAANSLLVLQEAGLSSAQPTPRAAGHHVLDSVFAASVDLPLDGITGEALWHPGQSLADLG